MVAQVLSLLVAHPWPLAPTDSTHPLGNNWGEYQDYGGGPYLHNGIDVFPELAEAPCYAVAPGYVKAWMTIAAEWHWRVATGDNPGSGATDGWLYAHIDSARWHADLGDTVQTGDLVGYLVFWPVTGFHHTHFSRIRDSGAVWNNANWAFIHNPLLTIDNLTDTVNPTFESAWPGPCNFAFAQNQSANYLSYDSLYGDVDIIVRAYDEIGHPTIYSEWDQLNVYRLTYEIKGPQNIPETNSFIFSDTLEGWMAGVIFKDDATLDTKGDYSDREYYYVMTNSDGDSSIEWSDRLESWNTASFPDGWYWVIVRLYDEAGGSSADSCYVRLANGTGVSEGGGGKPAFRVPALLSPGGAFKAGGWGSLTLFDVTGRMAARLWPSGGEFVLPKLARGLYFVRVDGTGRLFKTVVR